jgi:hypothetical protein
MLVVIVALVLAAGCAYAARKCRPTSRLSYIVLLALTVLFIFAAVWVLKDVAIHSTTTLNHS